MNTQNTAKLRDGRTVIVLAKHYTNERELEDGAFRFCVRPCDWPTFTVQDQTGATFEVAGYEFEGFEVSVP